MSQKVPDLTYEQKTLINTPGYHEDPTADLFIGCRRCNKNTLKCTSSTANPRGTCQACVKAGTKCKDRVFGWVPILETPSMSTPAASTSQNILQSQRDVSDTEEASISVASSASKPSSARKTGARVEIPPRNNTIASSKMAGNFKRTASSLVDSTATKKRKDFDWAELKEEDKEVAVTDEFQDAKWDAIIKEEDKEVAVTDEFQDAKWDAIKEIRLCVGEVLKRLRENRENSADHKAYVAFVEELEAVLPKVATEE
ncbi:hypothetical protein P389DRAFT_191030 [Cystobasidium minutum MCA 4210]|uniref:uncharacterized protein n=1 Tax=Cystobasidium minutum MCA 4210 TaxID=1397322 RepID=UPI0034CF5C91|eukprot:jgi/Rhomi1/191030/estExt_fgenesh1_pg.C_70001